MISNNTQEKSYLCTTCESRLHSLQDAQTSLASHSFALPLHQKSFGTQMRQEAEYKPLQFAFYPKLENELEKRGTTRISKSLIISNVNL